MKNKGFSVIELMVTLAIAGIILSAALPSFTSFIKKGRISATITELQAYVGLARTEAVKGNQTVTICAGTYDSSTKTGSCGNDWSLGWIVFTDLNADRTIDSSDNDVLIKVYQGKGDGSSITFSGGNASYIQFLSRGFTNSTTGTFTVCDSAKDIKIARGIVVTSTGSNRRTIDSNDDGVFEDHAGTSLACI